MDKGWYGHACWYHEMCVFFELENAGEVLRPWGSNMRGSAGHVWGAETTR